MRHLRVDLCWLPVAALLLPGCVPAAEGAGSQEVPGDRAVAPAPEPTATPEPPPTRTVEDVLTSGVVITVSLASQQMHVFRDGVLWRSSPVSTGRPGKETPTGVFAILQKKTFHRSNLYSNAPMPFMQRLTWDGVAIHGGHLPGYPASHGCIRVPKAFASELFKITRASSTAVIVVEDALPSAPEALAVAQRTGGLVPIPPDVLRREAAALARSNTVPAAARLPASRTIPPQTPAEIPSPAAPPAAAKGQTIQLMAALSQPEAQMHWDMLLAQRPELRSMRVTIVPAVVKGTQYYRLRASAPDAHRTCIDLKRAGIDCFPVS